MLHATVSFLSPMPQIYSTNNGLESYLRTRTNAKYDSGDFDSLSNRLLSKLVIRAN